MKSLPKNAFDLAIVDPPYGIDIAEWDSKENKPSKEYFNELKRISKEWIIWGANYFNIVNNNNYIIWDKKPFLKTQSQSEMAFCSFKTNAIVYSYQYAGNFENGKVDYKKLPNIHPTQKPIKLYEWLLTNYAKQGDKILDTHLGSGSHAIACNNLGFELVGLELDSDYFKASCERIAKEAQQERLF
jgi:site-specific DNA-methyltransferase (adenine-specific)